MRSLRVLAVCLPVVALVLSSAAAADDRVFLNTWNLRWADAPPTLPKGAKITVLYGDPGKAGPFVMRMIAPAGYKVPPHWHSQTENLTIISGVLYLGEGDTMDVKSAHALKPGGYHYLPAKAHHYAFTKSATVIQIHGEGPFDIVWVDEKDDPQKMARR